MTVDTILGVVVLSSDCNEVGSVLDNTTGASVDLVTPASGFLELDWSAVGEVFSSTAGWVEIDGELEDSTLGVVTDPEAIVLTPGWSELDAVLDAIVTVSD